MRLIDLFDQEDPKCLYCKGREFTTSSSSQYTPKGLIVNHDHYDCKWCEDRFTITWIGKMGEEKNEANIFGFDMTCNEIVIQQMAIQDTISLYGSEAPPVIIPFFIPDFSDKSALYNKLKTYIVFS
jgi:hypothetical protein